MKRQKGKSIKEHVYIVAIHCSSQKHLSVDEMYLINWYKQELTYFSDMQLNVIIFA